MLLSYNACSHVKGMAVLALFLFLTFYYIMVNKCWTRCFLVAKPMRNNNEIKQFKNLRIHQIKINEIEINDCERGSFLVLFLDNQLKSPLELFEDTCNFFTTVRMIQTLLRILNTLISKW